MIAAADNMYNEQIQQQKQSQSNNNANSNSDESNADKQLNQGRTKIYQLAHDLERRMREFDERVARRRYVLDVNLNFHTHCEEVRMKLQYEFVFKLLLFSIQIGWHKLNLFGQQQQVMMMIMKQLLPIVKRCSRL